MTRSASPEQSTERLIDASTIGDLVGCSVRHIYRLADAGKLPPGIRVGVLRRWRESEIRDWIAEGCPPVGKEASR